MNRTFALAAIFFSPLVSWRQGSAKPLSFEVASLKVNRFGSPGMDVEFSTGRVVLKNVTMRVLLMGAYDVIETAVLQGPSWINTDRFDLTAKANPGASIDDLRRMLQTVLAERFKLVVHREERPLTVYALAVGKGGPKMKASSPATDEQDRCGPTEGQPGLRHLICRHMTMQELAEQLPRIAPGYIDMPVVDATGVQGSWEFKLDWSPAGKGLGGKGGRGRAMAEVGGAAVTADPGVVTLFDSLQAQAGLKLESRRMPMPAVLIDHIERTPAEN